MRSSPWVRGWEDEAWEGRPGAETEEEVHSHVSSAPAPAGPLQAPRTEPKHGRGWNE